MKNFDVRIVSKDIINGEPLATCVLTYDNQYFETIRYNYFNNDWQRIDIINNSQIKKMFNISTMAEYETLMSSIADYIYDAILG